MDSLRKCIWIKRIAYASAIAGVLWYGCPVASAAGQSAHTLNTPSHARMPRGNKSGEMLFSQIVNPEGDRRIRSIIQLDDGRMLFATPEGVEIFDGAGFTRMFEVTGQSLELPDYDGFHHLYLSHSGRYLWIKNFHTLHCVDLDTGIYVTDIAGVLQEQGFPAAPDDIFGDSGGRLWVVKEGRLMQPASGLDIPLYKPGERNDTNNLLIDLAVDGNQLTLFFRNGRTDVYSLAEGRLLHTSSAFLTEELPKFMYTSLVVDAPEAYYQIRNGAVGGLFRLDKQTGEWLKMLESNLRLNTLAVLDSALLITTTEGLLSVPRMYGTAGRTVGNSAGALIISHSPQLRTRTGKLLASEVSTISTDKEGGVWIGTLNRGLLYYHPAAFRHYSLERKGGEPGRSHCDSDSGNKVFSEGPDGSVYLSENGRTTRIELSEGCPVLKDIGKLPFGVGGEYGMSAFVSSDGSLFFSDGDSYEIYLRNDSLISGRNAAAPIISSLLVNGQKIEPLKAYDGNVILNKVASRQGKVVLQPTQNFVTFELSMPAFSAVDAPVYYRLEGVDRDWNRSTPEEMRSKRVRVTYPALSPGRYTFRAKGSLHGQSGSDATASSETVLVIEVKAPWWATVWAVVAYVLTGLAAVVAGIQLYVRRTKRRIEADQRERHLLERIRLLIEEVDRYKASSQPTSMADKGIGMGEVSESDREFISKAVETVERNLGTPGYSVAQLSRDMCMDRTGLYRKLNAMLDRSPSLFIRDIRLSNAARLLREGKLSVTEISERTGFSTPSYMSKCFQERYGCRPSEYAARGLMED